MTKRVKIEDTSVNFIEYLYNFLIEKSIEFNREVKINRLLNTYNDNIYNEMSKLSPIDIEPTIGTTYTSMYRSSTDLYDSTHFIKSIEVVKDGIYGNMEIIRNLDSDSNRIMLSPIYDISDKPWKILTFDIYYNKI